MNNRGAGLVELMCAVSIFALGAVSILHVFNSGTLMAQRGQYAYTAHNLAKNHVERLKALDFSLLPTAVETETVLNQDGVPDLNGAFVRSTAVSTNYQGHSDLTQVSVSLNYLLKGARSPNPVQVVAVILDT